MIKKSIYLIIGFCLTPGCSFVPDIVPELTGQDKAFVQRRLGPPVVARTEASYQIWSYRRGDCSILIFFDTADQVRFVDTSGSCSEE